VVISVIVGCSVTDTKHFTKSGTPQFIKQDLANNNKDKYIPVSHLNNYLIQILDISGTDVDQFN
jgi:hypothetical protein